MNYRRSLALASAVVLMNATAGAQTHHAGPNPLPHANNPIFQANGVATGYNNPLQQGVGFGTGYNNPLSQGVGFGGGYNNPLLQGVGFGAGYNNPLNQSQGFGTGFNDPLRQINPQVVGNTGQNTGGGDGSPTDLDAGHYGPRGFDDLADAGGRDRRGE